jgi:hypothetical protein
MNIMQSALRLTITAVGEPDSVFLTPCDPITLFESVIEVEDDTEAAADEQARHDAADALADLAGDSGVIIMGDEEDHSMPPRAPMRRSA